MYSIHTAPGFQMVEHQCLLSNFSINSSGPKVKNSTYLLLFFISIQWHHKPCEYNNYDYLILAKVPALSCRLGRVPYGALTSGCAPHDRAEIAPLALS